MTQNRVSESVKFLESLISQSTSQEKYLQFSYFYDYIFLYNKFIFEENHNSNSLSKNPLFRNFDNNDILADFIIKKIHFSLILRKFRELENLIKEQNPHKIINNDKDDKESTSLTNVMDNNTDKILDEFFEDLICYIKKVLDNLKEFLIFCFKAKSKLILENDQTPLDFLYKTLGGTEILDEKYYTHILHKYLICVYEKINLYLIRVLSQDEAFMQFLNKSIISQFSFFKKFLELDDTVKKQNFAKNYQLQYSVIEIFIYNNSCISKLQDILLMQKNFTENYFQSNISKNFIENLEKENLLQNNYSDDNLFSKLKIIFKDNFSFLSAFQKSNEIFSIIYKENYKFIIKELLIFLTSVYNKQVSYFSTARKINKLNILFLIEFCINFLNYKNKILLKVNKTNWQDKSKEIFFDRTDSHKSSVSSNISAQNNLKILNNHISKHNDYHLKLKNVENFLFYEALSILNNFIILLTKEFKEKSFCNMIDLFEYNNLVKLDQEKIDTVTHCCNEDLKNLIICIDKSNLKKENEYVIYEIILFDILSHINRELEESLKKAPKSKYFGLLADKVINIFNQLVTKFNKFDKEDRESSLLKLIKKFNSYMKTLKLNII